MRKHLLLLVAVVLFPNDNLTFPQDIAKPKETIVNGVIPEKSGKGEISKDPFTATANLAKVIVVKFDPSQPDVLQALMPTIIYAPTYSNVKIKVAKSSSDQSTVEPKSKPEVVEEMKRFDNLLETYGPMVKNQIFIKDIRFSKLDGTEIPLKEAQDLLKKPTHVVYGQLPDAYLARILKDDTIVILPSPTLGFLRPMIKRIFPGQ